MASSTVPMPPAGLKPTFCLLSRIACNMMSAASSVALTATLPVEVLMKSAPSAMASSEARRMRTLSFSSPVSRMTLRSTGAAQALRTAATMVETADSSPAMNLR
ncbi:hypothetical protein D3C78_1409090 [compost metagenome]